MKNLLKIFFLPTLLSTFFITFKISGMDQTCSSDSVKIIEYNAFSLTQDVIWEEATIFKGDCEIDGKNFALSFAPNASITLAENSTLHLKNITLKNIDQKIKLAANTSKIKISECVTWEINDYFKFDSGSFVVSDYSRLRLHRPTKDGHKSTFLYTSDQKSFLFSNASIELENVIFSYSPKASAENLISLNCIDSCIYLNKSKIFLSKNLHLTYGCIYTNGKNQILGQKGITLTLGNEKHDTPIFLASNATLEVTNIQIIKNTKN